MKGIRVAGVRLLVKTLILLTAFVAGSSAFATEVTADADRLRRTLDAMQVESHWPAGEHVNWESGVPDGRPETAEGRHTHCSAFVAATAKRLGIYILRPPEHPQVLLANAQYDWLADSGATRGWQPLTDARTAQAYANRGWFVVATYRNHHDNKPGHIAVVRPSEKGQHVIDNEGPQITQAGSVNYNSTSLAHGFAGHPAAWGHQEVRYYAHAIDWPRMTSP
jgi:hypothetical protein